MFLLISQAFFFGVHGDWENKPLIAAGSESWLSIYRTALSQRVLFSKLDVTIVLLLQLVVRWYELKCKTPQMAHSCCSWSHCYWHFPLQVDRKEGWLLMEEMPPDDQLIFTNEKQRELALSVFTVHSFFCFLFFFLSSLRALSVNPDNPMSWVLLLSPLFYTWRNGYREQQLQPKATQ